MRDTMTDATATRALLVCGAIACPLFVVAFLAEGATRAGYDPLRHPISSLSIGELGWMQAANFLVTGLLLLAFAVGLRRALGHSSGAIWGPRLMALVAVGLIGAGFFPTDPIYGYPPDQPLLLAQSSLPGRIHNLFSLFVFAGLPFACRVFHRRFSALGEQGWATYSAFTGIGMLAMFVLAAFGFSQTPGLVGFAGVFQRLSILIGWTWITLLAVHFLRMPGPPANPS